MLDGHILRLRTLRPTELSCVRISHSSDGSSTRLSGCASCLLAKSLTIESSLLTIHFKDREIVSLCLHNPEHKFSARALQELKLRIPGILLRWRIVDSRL